MKTPSWHGWWTGIPDCGLRGPPTRTSWRSAPCSAGRSRSRPDALSVTRWSPRTANPAGAVRNAHPPLPRADDLAQASLAEIGMPGSRRTALRTLGAALADGTVVLDAGADRDEAERALLGLRGIGPWTAGYIRMRALGDPDVLLTGDAAVLAGMRRAGVPTDSVAARSDDWRPWRSYALHHFWNVPVAGPAHPHPSTTESTGP
ncbi:hypothetical protein O1L68_38075 [Streptomyces lydicus]|nr:hypothetical protein [Streptomyces lydicus]